MPEELAFEQRFAHGAEIDGHEHLGRMPAPVLRKVAVEDLYARVAQLMGPELERRGIALERNVAPRRLTITADPDLLEQALINLVRNAVDALADSAVPVVRLSAELDSAGRAVLGVTDNGQGMDAHARANIFVPFFTTKRHGTGVGLSLVRQIMRAHRGTVGVRSAPGEGTAVRLSF